MFFYIPETGIKVRNFSNYKTQIVIPPQNRKPRTFNTKNGWYAFTDTNCKYFLFKGSQDEIPFTVEYDSNLQVIASEEDYELLDIIIVYTSDVKKGDLK